ncbi:MAG: MTH1187 family thiamine-binding protein [Gammaproteobacteria bacterium]|nr:MTH1187 family thiamine-binding protein [Gammaproteobacteria bacterium]MDH3534616.1 MTH1187 family thiamine-binding protein [Gammaproteobacteria bacterium]
MKVLIDICVVPMGVGVSVSEYVVECQRIFEAAGLHHELHPWGTNVEGEWDKVMAAVKQCHEKMHEMDAPRCISTLRIGTRIDREQSMQDKIDSVYSKMAI